MHCSNNSEIIVREMYYVNDINLVPKMGQIIKVQRPVSSASISGLYVILEAAFTIALLGGIIVQLVKSGS
jgi:hypothetical protein